MPFPLLQGVFDAVFILIRLSSLSFFSFNCIHLLLAALGLCSCGGFPLVAVHGLLIGMVAVAEHGLQGTGLQELQPLGSGVAGPRL